MYQDNGFYYELLPALRMLLTGPGRPGILRLEDSPEMVKVSRNKETFGNWQQNRTGEPVVYLNYTKGESTDKTGKRFHTALPEGKGMAMIQNAGLLAYGPDTSSVRRMLSGQKQENGRAGKPGPFNQQVVVITGAAQGFGKGLAEHFAEDGANVIIADLNKKTGKQTAKELQTRATSNEVLYLPVNVTESSSVEELLRKIIRKFGGIDIFISNAGILKAGSLNTLDLRDFDFVNDVNYRGFFLCTKYASRVMRTQHRYRPDFFMDIIQINSKSGLQGSDRNFAYAGSKFGSLGLVQSFAKELASEKIKVNAVCPGNFFDGPLWSDPKNGLFTQYLQTGKVPGAKSIEDIKKHYEQLVPMNRGCRIADVYKAVKYLAEQEYETGQALPVTGGQIMLH